MENNDKPILIIDEMAKKQIQKEKYEENLNYRKNNILPYNHSILERALQQKIDRKVMDGKPTTGEPTTGGKGRKYKKTRKSKKSLKSKKSRKSRRTRK